MEWLSANWGLILAAIIALAFVLFIKGYYWNLKKEITELVNAITAAIEDGHVDDSELANILKEGKDVGKSLKTITSLVVKLIVKGRSR